MGEPIKTLQLNPTGRPMISEEQYQIWLGELKPFLENGHSLRYSIDKAGLDKHRTTIYEKIRLNDWFSDKINAFRNLAGELVNESFAHMLQSIHAKITKDDRLADITHDEIKVLTFLATHLKSADPFFVINQGGKSHDPGAPQIPPPVPQITYILPQD